MNNTNNTASATHPLLRRYTPPTDAQVADARAYNLEQERLYKQRNFGGRNDERNPNFGKCRD